MRFWTYKKAKDLFWTFLVFAAIFNFDRSYFFPVSAHTDWRFQLLGESLELLALVGLQIVARMLGKNAEFSPLNFRSRLYVSAIVPAVLFVTCWRDFFPNDHFSLSAGRMDFLYAPAAGLAIFGLWFVIGPTVDKSNTNGESPVASL
jgi:hypothetical protein